MGALKKRRRFFRDLSLRASYVVYTLLVFLGCTLLCSLIINLADSARMRLLDQYVQQAESHVIPEGGYYAVTYGDTLIFTIYDASGAYLESVPVDYSRATPMVDADGMVISLVPTYRSGDRMKDFALAAVQTMAIPVCYGAGAIFCAFLFFRRKLKAPIAVLADASGRIAASDLNFTIDYDSRDEMGALCRSFETMRRALEENNREMFRQMEERRQLNAAFSHDLRTPLTVLKGHADMLLAALPDEKADRDEMVREVQTMSANIRRLENYTEAMTKLQRLEDMEIRRADVGEGTLLRGLRSTAHILCAGKTLQWNETVTRAQWHVDPGIVMEVCENLLQNSARFARSSIAVTVSDADETLCVLVSDDGCGFSPRALDQAAKPFYRARESGEEGHLGIGLNICRILCSRHGGELTVANNVKGGALVCATFAMGA